MEKRPTSACANCRIEKSEKICLSEEGRGPKFCPTLNQAEDIKAATAEYDREDVGEFARQADETLRQSPGEAESAGGMRIRSQDVIQETGNRLLRGHDQRGRDTE